MEEIVTTLYDWLLSLPYIVPVMTSGVSAGISVAAFIRAGKPSLPTCWIEQKKTGSKGATVILRAVNKTDRPVRILSLQAKSGALLAASPADDEGPKALVLLIDREVPPEGHISLDVAIRLDDTSSPTKERMTLSVSTMRWVARKRRITMPIIIPAHADKK